jgi:colicin import membrane protein
LTARHSAFDEVIAMTARQTRMEFAPPHTPGLVRALGLAVLAHALLLAMLAVGVQWKREAPAVAVEAELWSALPVQAAPPAPEPVALPEPVVPRAVPPKAVVAPPAPPPPTPMPDPSIAIAKEKARLQKEKQAEKQLQQDKLEQETRQKETLKNKKLQDEKEARDKQAREKAVADKKQQQDLQAQSAKATAEAKKMAELRQQNIKRMAGLAASTGSGTGDTNSQGTAARSSGPSASYGSRLAAVFKRNLAFANSDSISGNPKTSVQVKVAPSGLILSFVLTKSSGVPAWDDAVLRAVEKTARIPADENGKVVTDFPLDWGPKD